MADTKASVDATRPSMLDLAVSDLEVLHGAPRGTRSLRSVVRLVLLGTAALLAVAILIAYGLVTIPTIRP